MLEDYEGTSRAFDGMAAYHYGFVNLTGDQAAERIEVGYLTDDMFDVLGAQTVRGRALRPGDGGAGGAGGQDVVVLDHGLWQRRWGGDPTLLGRSIELDGAPHTVVGVMALSSAWTRAQTVGPPKWSTD